MSLSYPSASEYALADISISVAPGASVARVEPTGSGKSTLADVFLGVIEPTAGMASISGHSPREAVAMWPAAMAYVPQEVAVLTGTVRSNVALGFPDADIDDALVWDALDRAHLSAFLKNSRDGLDIVLGEDGVRLSGGQRQ